MTRWNAGFGDGFRPGLGLPDAPGKAAWYAVSPEMPWRTSRDVTMNRWVGRERDEPVLEAGVELSLVAIWPCDDINGACGYWQGMQSAYAFRVGSGEQAGSIVESWGWQGGPPEGIEPVDVKAMVAVTGRLGYGLEEIA